MSLRLRASLIVLCLGAGLLVGLAGCGDDSGDTSVTSGKPPPESLAEPPPRGASPLLRDVYSQFQPPQADPGVKGAAKAIKAGARTCKGKTPLQIREEFISESDLSPDQAKTVAKLPSYEKSPSANFVAGQLAALVYENTLPEDELATYGFQGCIYALSLRLKRELAQGER